MPVGRLKFQTEIHKKLVHVNQVRRYVLHSLHVAHHFPLNATPLSKRVFVRNHSCESVVPLQGYFSPAIEGLVEDSIWNRAKRKPGNYLVIFINCLTELDFIDEVLSRFSF